MLDALLANAEWWLNASNRSRQRCVFHHATYKDVGMALNWNRLIVSIPPCMCGLFMESMNIYDILE
jgi:hypothetical protein